MDLKAFNKYVERRREYEKGRIEFVKGERDKAPPRPFEELAKKDKLTDVVNEINDELKQKMAEAFGENGEAKKAAEVRGLIRQAEHVYRAVRAEACRTKPFLSRLAAAYGRRINHTAEGGLIDKMVVDEIEKAASIANK